MSEEKAAEKINRSDWRADVVTRLYAQSQSALLAVEERIQSRLGSDARILSEISRYLLNLGGKRIRPLLAVTAARLFGMSEPSEQIIDSAAGIELIHMATLLHDDIIDRSATRRHRVSAYQLHGLAPTLCAGDFLLSRAFGLCARLDRFVIEKTEEACVELTEGEVLEGQMTGSDTRRLPEYVNIVRKKTGALFGLAAGVGAYLAGATRPVVDALEEFGLLCGTAFQMADDVLDVTADQSVLGKPSGTDLKQRTPSLVNILWLETGAPAAQRFFASDEPSDEQVQTALGEVRASPVITLARKISTEYALKAKDLLFGIENVRLDGDVREGLAALVDYTIERGK